ncbi:MAG: cytochrome c oxidase subunit II [Alphaproteobacteria bacterium]|nr:MAG: cytochrome c oxidase subunit II [Alphaproteobacteria bacterium]
MNKNILWTALLAFLGLVVLVDPALANEPVNWEFGFQPAATSSAERIQDFHTLLMIIITGITVFVTLLLIFVVIRYNKHVNKTPSKVTHNVLLEIVWTVLPIVLLIIIAIPSFKILYKNDRIVEPEMTLKITGYQWYWGYEYPDQGGLTFDSRMVATEDLRPDQKRLLSTDNVVVLPIDTDIAILVTSNDVIHAWTIPAFGVKIDTVPGRTNETWFRIDRPGVYYGQCSELCGKDHSFMPIEVHAVTKEEFKAWTLRATEEFSANDNFPKTIKLTALQQ